MLHVVYALNKGLKQLWEHIEEKKNQHIQHTEGTLPVLHW